MDLISAIKSGKPFKRKDWVTWVDVNYPEVELKQLTLDTESIVATDWIVEEEKIELTAEQVAKAMGKYPASIYHAAIRHVLKELGFKDI